MKYILLTFACILTLSACYKAEPYWLDENIKEGGTYYPLLQELFVIPADTTIAAIDDFTFGQEIKLTAQYWSRDEVSQIEFYRVEGSDTLELQVLSYDPVFDPVSEAYHQSVNYTLPSENSDSTFTFRAVVRTVHDLTRDRATSIEVK